MSTKECIAPMLLEPLEKLIVELGLKNQFKINITGADPILQSPHRLGEAVSYAMSLYAMTAASIWKHRTNQDNIINLNIHDAIHFLHTPHFIWQSGYQIALGAEGVATNGLFQCKDGRYIVIMSGPPYKKLETGYLNLFNCANNAEAIAKVIAGWNSYELEATLANLGLTGTIVNTKQEWRDHPQGKAILNMPLIEIEKIGEGEPQGFSSNPQAPLSGINVLDFTHVLAGPRSTQTLAEFGANVLHITSPLHADTLAQNFATNNGKKSAYLNLTQEKDLQRMQQLMSEADVFANSYRPSVMDKFSITPTDAVKLNSKGIIYLSVNTYGHQGPWKNRPGFDHNAQVASGFAATEGGAGKPKFSPVFYLTDLLTGYFATAGMMAALLRRAKEGGSYHVKVSLVKSAMWVQDLGYINSFDYMQQPTTDIYPVNLTTTLTPYGELTYLASAIHFSNMPKIQMIPVHPFGAHMARW